jgi:hypothetical protein
MIVTYAPRAVVPDEDPAGPHWTAEDGGCEGINHPEAPLVPLVEIRRRLLMQEAYYRRFPF